MAGSDAILVGEDWLSEHYFTTEATSKSFQALVIARRKEWEENKDLGTTLTRFAEHRRTILEQDRHGRRICTFAHVAKERDVATFGEHGADREEEHGAFDQA